MNNISEQVLIDGSYYKIGFHGKPFVLVDNDWVRSNKPVHVITLAIKNRSNKPRIKQ